MGQQAYWSADSAFEAERERLSILEHLFDDITQDSLTQLVVREGWWCCEIGAGGGSITRWLSQVVGPKGRVVAVDLDTRFLTDIDQANVEVIKADFLSNAPIGDSFDLVCSRAVLGHLSDPERAVRRMVQLVKPNGWVFTIDADLCILSAADPGHRDASRFDEVCRKAAGLHLRALQHQLPHGEKSLQAVRGGGPRRRRQLGLDGGVPRWESSGGALAPKLASFRAKDDGRRSALTRRV